VYSFFNYTITFCIDQGLNIAFGIMVIAQKV